LQTTTERKLLEGSQWQRVTQADGSVLTQWDEMNGGTRIEHAQQVNGAVTVTQTRTYQNGALVSETQPGMTQAITYRSNALGEITQVVHPLSGTITRTYDAQGRNCSRSRKAAAGTETYAYNALGQVASITHADNTTTTYTYDAQGRQLSQGGTAGYALSYEYDAMGRLWKLHTTARQQDDVTTWEYVTGHECAGKQDRRGNRSVTYTYNAAGRQQTRGLAARQSLRPTVTMASAGSRALITATARRT
jgi:YD repeat-containing protein